MSKKSLLALLIALILVLIGIGSLFYFQSFRTVTLNFKKTDFTVTVYEKQDDNQTEIDNLDKTTDLRLQKGTYVLVPDGDIYSPAPIEFKVNDQDMTVDIDPDLSSRFRTSLLVSELPTIKSALSAAYPNTINNFVINDGEIYKQGQWYATTLVQKVTGNEEGDVYRTVLKKEGEKWSVKAKPALVLSSKTYPDIPKEILSSVNAKD
jgi:hypothetical protein